MDFRETIVALSSGRLPAGVAVVRASGPKTRFVIETISGKPGLPRRAVLRSLKLADGSILDRGLVIFFPAPDSFTGEDVAEFHVHGGRAVVSALLRRLTEFDGVRNADAGEFTRRAFLNGKLDLVKTEALADLINAETEAQRRFAARNADGAQSELYELWRRRLIRARAMLEADIDFADEDDVPGSVADLAWQDMAQLSREIERHLNGFHAAEIIRDGFDVVILGAPNAGKSSLFNALARRDAAIVSDEPGTTRDLLELSLDLEGLKVNITDTAGLRDAAGKVESIGIERARNRAKQADLVLLLEDMSAKSAASSAPPDVQCLKIGTKLDLAGASHPQGYDFLISSQTGEGLPELLKEIGSKASAMAERAGDILPSRLRHVELLNESHALLNRALASDKTETELRAEDLRLVSEQLGRIIGAVDVEDLLDVIFSQFCIGK
ncbi:tRNA uridine-5-carboxymethylaminomethyl(34) synthesis GTPase MnmE [Mesorhizobium sp. SP-1A]|uniref:tRNA uridine-5-carboxymethylaminomethyl(34) synthesis GTPase MnmE n=1 Tax=Mesorhizobium sp. SP-1A TaxID=3077840 RepID=UPI0028F6CEEE|nr:tRNA uridine-5-carboxymethylaminomethyl(34) synthesis GTPase MnmE [Mesorhizobium sp. SP-1A]